jgi:hypothetical protein
LPRGIDHDQGREGKVSRKITGRVVVVFAAGTALVTAALFAVAAIAEDDYSFDRRGGRWPSPSDTGERRPAQARPQVSQELRL